MSPAPAPVAIITGAARGIGAATARVLSAEGWSLLLLDSCADDPAVGYPLATRDELVGVVTACGGADGRSIGVVADVRQPAGLAGAVELAVDRFGGLDAAVAAAGVVAGDSPVWTIPDQVWAATIGVNLEGTWRLATATVPAMLRRAHPRQGRFVAVAPATGTDGLGRFGAHVAAAHGVHGLVRTLAAELYLEGVTANVVAAGPTHGSVRQAPEHRLVSADEVAALVAWVCGRSSSGITGTVLTVDGGWGS